MSNVLCDDPCCRQMFERWMRGSDQDLTPLEDDYRSATISMAWQCFQYGWIAHKGEFPFGSEEPCTK